MLKIAQKLFLEQNDISEESLKEILEKMLTKSIDFSEMFFQYSIVETWNLEDGIINMGSFLVDQGVGIRAISGEKTGFAYSDELSLIAIRDTAAAACNIATSGPERKIKIWNKKNLSTALYLPNNPISETDDINKIALLQMVNNEARRQDSRVKQVIANLVGSYEVILIVSSDGVFVADIRPLTRLNVTVVMEANGKYERGYMGGGRRSGYEFFYESEVALQYAREAVRIAGLNMEATSAPAGMMPVVLGNGWPGVLIHEAVGHGLEGDFIRKKSSIYADKLGKVVASSACTIVDQGNLPENRRGSLQVDDEGTITQCTMLIENGVLCSYMYDKLNAKLMHTKPTGNARRESYAYYPIPRMTNTFMLQGQYEPEEIIKSVERGIYAVNFSGGQVDITSGEFVFSTSEAYLIENGKIINPVKGATLIGNGHVVLKKIEMVGNDLRLDSGIGLCGKDGQNVPVGVGQPTLKIAELTVGGTI